MKLTRTKGAVRYFVVLLVSVSFGQTVYGMTFEVRRASSVYFEPVSGTEKIMSIGESEVPMFLQVVSYQEKTNGYYRVFVPNSTDVGWIHKSRGRLNTDQQRDLLTAYSREAYKHWIDADGDCQNSRQEVLVRDSNPEALEFRDERECDVSKGEWLDPFTGETLTNPSDIDVDHLVPLGHAHIHGAWNWSEARREEYANYLENDTHLLAVRDAENQQKGEKAPHEYLPPNEAYHCEYVKEWIDIKRMWGLFLTVREAEMTIRKIIECEAQGADTFYR